MKILNRDDFGEKKKRIANFLPYFRLISFLFVIFIVFLGIKLYFTNLLATSGVQLTATAQRIEKLEKENVKLENEISRLGSVSRLQSEAKKQGFKLQEKVQVLVTPRPVAQKP